VGDKETLYVGALSILELQVRGHRKRRQEIRFSQGRIWLCKDRAKGWAEGCGVSWGGGTGGSG
jgi:hypothetical protein